MWSNKKIIKSKLWLPALITIAIVIIIPFILNLVHIPNKIPEGKYIKLGNHIFYDFIENVKKEKGILILGTSETGNTMSGNNYWGLLDKDIDLNRSFYALGGAGRSANVYFPLILNNPEAFRDLEVIYYINPTYWRVTLNYFDTEYFSRYVDSKLVIAVKSKAIKAKLYQQFMSKHKTFGLPINNSAHRFIDNFKSYYYHDLNSWLSDKNISSTDKIDINQMYDSVGFIALKSEINLDKNVTFDYLSKYAENTFPIIDTSVHYQYDLLKAFIKLTKTYNINCTFYLGPFNEIYCKQKNPEFIDDHHLVVENIKQILVDQEVNFIDGSHLSRVAGTFWDVQHISEYGAYLTALQIKAYYEKNN